MSRPSSGTTGTMTARLKYVSSGLLLGRNEDPPGRFGTRSGRSIFCLPAATGMFYNGLAANNSPIRVLATTGGLVAGERIASGGASTIVTAGLYSFIRAVPARFSTNSTLVANASTLDAIYRLTPSGSTTEPQVMPTREGPVLNVPQREWSSLPNVGTGAKVAVVGDWKSGYVIVDRVGMSIELVPHLLGSNRRPSASRGLFAWWRVGASVLAANALRYMEVAAS